VSSSVEATAAVPIRPARWPWLALAGFIVTAICWPPLSSSAASARAICGAVRDSVERAHGMSMLLGLAMLSVPMAPAALYIFQRSAADPKCACSGPGSDFGVDDT